MKISTMSLVYLAIIVSGCVIGFVLPISIGEYGISFVLIAFFYEYFGFARSYLILAFKTAFSMAVSFPSLLGSLDSGFAIASGIITDPEVRAMFQDPSFRALVFNVEISGMFAMLALSLTTAHAVFRKLGIYRRLPLEKMH